MAYEITKLPELLPESVPCLAIDVRAAKSIAEWFHAKGSLSLHYYWLSVATAIKEATSKEQP